MELKTITKYQYVLLHTTSTFPVITIMLPVIYDKVRA